MDLINSLMNEGTVLDGTVIVKLLILAFIIEFFGIASYWVRRF